MSSNRKAFIDVACNMIQEIIPGSEYPKVLRTALESMTEKAFQAYVARLRNGLSENPDLNQPRELLPIIVPPLSKHPLDITRNFKLIEKWKVKAYERIWITDATTGESYLSTIPYMVLDMPFSRQAQTLDEKISVAKNNKHIDDRTNQSTGESKGASLSYPELQILLSNNLEKTALEMMKFRGGDETAFRVMNKQLQETGTFEQKSFDEVDTRAKASDTTSIYLKGMHLDNNL